MLLAGNFGYKVILMLNTGSATAILFGFRRFSLPEFSFEYVSTMLVGLDLFNDDTRPSGHISRPTQVNVSQSCFHSLNNYSSLIILYTSGG